MTDTRSDLSTTPRQRAVEAYENARGSVADAGRQAVDTLTVLVKENTLKTEEGTAAARAAYTEANHVNLKIEHLAEAGLLAQAAPPWDPTQGDRRAA